MDFACRGRLAEQGTLSSQQRVGLQAAEGNSGCCGELSVVSQLNDSLLLYPSVYEQDDIQGTAATAVAGLFGAMRVLGKPTEALAQQRVLCVGAGSAGMGVVSMIARAMEKQGQSTPQSNFWVLDKVCMCVRVNVCSR